MKIKLYMRVLLIASLFFIYLLTTIPTLYSMELMEEAVGPAALESVDKTAMESAINDAVAESLGTSVPSLESLPKEVTEGFKEDLSKFVNDPATQELLKTPEGIKEFGQKLQTQLQTSFTEKFKPAVQGVKVFTPEQLDALAGFNKQFTPEDIANLRSLKEVPIQDTISTVKVPEAAIPANPNQAALDDFVNAANELKASTNELAEVTSSNQVREIHQNAQQSSQNMSAADANIKTSENNQIQTAENTATQADTAVKTAQNNLSTAQKTGDSTQVENAKNKVNDAQQQASETKESAKKQLVESSKKQYERASRKLTEANDYLKGINEQLSDLDAGKGPFKDIQKDSGEYNNFKQELTKAQTDAQEIVDQAKDTVSETRERFEKVVSTEGSIKEQIALKVKNAAKFFAEQTLMGIIFMLPGWAAQSIIEARQKKALLDTLRKNQQFGKVYMTLPRCFINNNNPAASFYMYVGLEEQNKNNTFNGNEEYLSKPANYYVAVPSYGQWASVAITDPTFPNVMAHLDTGFIFDGDGSPSDVQCPAAQLIGTVPQSYSACGIVLQEQKLNNLSGPANASAVASLYASQTPWEGEEASGYQGSPTIAGLLDSSKNTDWKIFYPAVKANNETSLMYGSILNPAIGAFRSKTKVGNFQLQEFQGLGTDLGKLGAFMNEPGVEGDEKKPYVAQGLWIYQTQDTPQLKTVINQLQAKGELNLVPLVWDYIIALDNDGKIIQLHEIYPGDNGFQHYTFNASQTKVKFLCSLLQPGVIGGQQVSFEIYELDGDMWKSNTDLGFPNPLADKNSKLFINDNSLQNQIATMYKFVEGRVVSGPFLIGSKQLQISDDLLAANMPIYKVAGSLADGSDDYVVAVSWPPNILQLPDASAKYLWSLVTSRVYQPNNFAPNTEEWYVKISGDGSDASPYKVGFSNIPKDGFPYQAPLYSVIMPQGVNPNIVTYNNQQISLPAPDLYATKLLPITIGGTTKPIGQFLSAADAPDAIKKVWQEINNSFASWKGFLHSLEDAQRNNVDVSIMPKTWVKDRFPPILLQATNEADIINGFYVYKTDEYPGEFLVMSGSSDLSDPDLGKEFDTTNPQQYLISLSTGNIYDGKNEGKLAPVPSVDPTATWQQVQKNSNWPGKLLTWQQQVTTLQNQVKTLTGDDLTKAQNELAMLQQLLAQVNDPANPNNKVSQAQANFNNLNVVIINSQKTFGSQTAAQQYGNNLFGPFNFFINKKDLQNRAYFYQDVTNIANPMSNLDANGDVKGVTDYYVCGQTQKDGSIMWGYQLDGSTDRVLDLITGAVYSRGGFQGTYTIFSQAYGNASSNKNAQILIDDYLNTVFAAIKAQFGVSPRPEMQTAIQKLLTPQYNLLEKEKQQVIAQEQQEQAQFAPMDSNLMANLNSAKYLANYSTLSQQSLKNYAGKYYLVPQDDSGNIVSYTDYNVGPSGKDNNVGATYDLQGNMLVRLTDWPLQNMRAKVGVVVDAKGQQTLAIGVDQPMIPLQNLVKLASIPSTGTPTAQDAALKQQVDAAQTVYNSAMNAIIKSPQDAKAQQQILQAASDLAAKRLMYSSARMLSVAIQNNYITPSQGWTYEYYYDTQTGSYFGKIMVGSTAYYLELSSGFTYETNGVPRVRKSAVYVDTGTNLEAMTWFDGDTKHRMLLAILPTSTTGKQFAVYRATLQIPPSTFTPQEGQAMVTYQNEPAIQQQCTNINNPDDDKMVVTNDYVRGTNKNVAFMDVWDVVPTDAGDNLTEIGSFKPMGSQYFAHLAYVQTRAVGQASGTFDPQNVQVADDIPTVMVWDGGSDLKLQQLYYQYQFIPLTASGANAFTGSYTDTSGKSNPITVTKEQKTLTTGTGPTIIAMWISVTDGNKIIDYHYDTSFIEQDAMNQLKQLWGINVVTNAYGQSCLVTKFDSLKHNVTVANVPSNQQTIINQILPNIGFDAAASRFLYKLTTAQATAYGLESYDPTMNNWYVDMSNGILFDLNDYPSGKTLQASDLSKLMNNLQIGVGFDANGIPSSLHYRTATDIEVTTIPPTTPAPKALVTPRPAAMRARRR